MTPTLLPHPSFVRDLRALSPSLRPVLFGHEHDALISRLQVISQRRFLLCGLARVGHVCVAGWCFLDRY